MKELLLHPVTKAPKAPKGFVPVTTAISLTGKALYLFVEEDAKDLVRRRSGGGQDASFPVSGMGRPYVYKLLVSGIGEFKEITLPPFEFAFPLVDILSNGSVVIVGARCNWPDDQNGMIFDPASGHTARFLAGDGIQDIGVDGLNRIWVSLFDEGVFGNNAGAGRKDVNWRSGLNCFSGTGEILWRFDDPVRHIDDCYALNVTGRKAHFYYYSDFDLGTVSEDWSTRFTKTDVSGCGSFAISPEGALFSAGYKDGRDVVTLIRFSGAPRQQQFRMRLPNSGKMGKGHLIGRGAALYYFADKELYRLDMSLALYNV